MFSDRIALIVLAVYVTSFSYLYLRCRDRLPFIKYLSNHFLLLSPLNFLLTFFSKDRGTAVFPSRTVPGLLLLRDNFELIRDEAQGLLDAGMFHRRPSVDEPGYNTFERTGWRKFPLKWYRRECNDPAVELCPRTCALLNRIPEIRSAMFTVLPPDGRIGRHHDPLATCLRYHIGLVTPNSERCALTLDGKTYPWRDGEDLLFDQTFLHSAVNETGTPRVILFCDVEKPQLRGFARLLAKGTNDILVSRLAGADATGHRSWISKLYQPVYQVRWFFKTAVRDRSPLLYDLIKFGSIATLIILALLAPRLW